MEKWVLAESQKETWSWPYNLVGEGLPETTNKWLSPQNELQPSFHERQKGQRGSLHQLQLRTLQGAVLGMKVPYLALALMCVGPSF
jgi:hypothetical protein